MPWCPVAATDKAQPLYERALAIYEKVYGPDHPEVAHTLTDLAVLHLEAVRTVNAAHNATAQIATVLPGPLRRERANGNSS
jgi:hypothetical protein